MAKRRLAKQRKTILFADDDVWVLESWVSLLEAEGFNVLRATSAHQALSLFKKHQHRINLVLLDIRMPVGHDSELARSKTDYGRSAGFAVAREIRKRCPKVPLLALSAWADPEIVEWFSKYGAGYLVKGTIRPDDILETIRSATSKRKRKRQPKCFIVHGHDTDSLTELKEYLEVELKFRNVVVLRDQPSLGRTIIEKFEDEAGKVDVVFVVLTPDDKAAAVSAPDDIKRRARQNVIFEMGYFLAKLQRRSGRVILLHKGEVELPTDISGVVYVDISKGIRKAKASVERELAEWL